jgi:hypothetical protein
MSEFNFGNFFGKNGCVINNMPFEFVEAKYGFRNAYVSPLPNPMGDITEMTHTYDDLGVAGGGTHITWTQCEQAVTYMAGHRGTLAIQFAVYPFTTPAKGIVRAWGLAYYGSFSMQLFINGVFVPESHTVAYNNEINSFAVSVAEGDKVHVTGVAGMGMWFKFLPYKVPYNDYQAFPAPDPEEIL